MARVSRLAGRRQGENQLRAHPPTAKRRRNIAISDDDDEDDNEETGKPVKRTTQACASCRVKKIRCDGQRPSCWSCSVSDTQCTYGTVRKKRGLPTGYVRVLEALWSLVFKVVPCSQETLLTLLEDTKVKIDANDRFVLQSPYTTDIDILRNGWVNSQVRVKIEEILSHIDASELPDSIVELTQADPTSTFSPWLLPHQNDSTQFLKKLPKSQPGPADNEVLCQSLPPDAWELLDTYLRYNHCWFPTIPKHTIVRSLYSYGQAESESTGGSQALLWSVFALASSLTAQHTDSERQQYFKIARAMIPQENVAFTLKHVAALLLLTIVHTTRSEWAAAFLLVGHTVSIIHLKGAESAEERVGVRVDSDVESESMRRRLMLGAFALDSIISSRLNVLPHLRSRDIEEYLSFDVNGPEEWEPRSYSLSETSQMPSVPYPVRALSTFLEWIKLLKVLNDVICDIRAGKQGQDTSLTRSEQLGRWKFNLPQHLVLPANYCASVANKQPDLSPPVANLFLTFAAVVTYLNAVRPHIQTSCDLHVVARNAYSKAFGPYVWQGLLLFHSDRVGSGLSKEHDIANSTALEIQEANISSHIRSTPNHLGQYEYHVPISPQARETLPRMFNQNTSTSFENSEKPENMLLSLNPPTSKMLSLPTVTNDSSAVVAGDQQADQGWTIDDFHTIATLVEELSSANDSTLPTSSHQYLYNLGYYDGEPLPSQFDSDSVPH